jgi:hypothetical protein
MMTDEKNFSLIAQYREHLEKLKAENIKIDYDAYSPSREDALNHLLSMLPKMEEFIREGRREKFFRWLGFIQGVLWFSGEFSLNDLRNHNRPPANE